jgi:hypothetical protein
MRLVEHELADDSSQYKILRDRFIKNPSQRERLRDALVAEWGKFTNLHFPYCRHFFWDLRNERDREILRKIKAQWDRETPSLFIDFLKRHGLKTEDRRGAWLTDGISTSEVNDLAKLPISERSEYLRLNFQYENYQGHRYLWQDLLEAQPIEFLKMFPDMGGILRVEANSFDGLHLNISGKLRSLMGRCSAKREMATEDMQALRELLPSVGAQVLIVLNRKNPELQRRLLSEMPDKHAILQQIVAYILNHHDFMTSKATEVLGHVQSLTKEIENGDISVREEILKKLSGDELKSAMTCFHWDMTKGGELQLFNKLRSKNGMESEELLSGHSDHLLPSFQQFTAQLPELIQTIRARPSELASEVLDGKLKLDDALAEINSILARPIRGPMDSIDQGYWQLALIPEIRDRVFARVLEFRPDDDWNQVVGILGTMSRLQTLYGEKTYETVPEILAFGRKHISSREVKDKVWNAFETGERPIFEGIVGQLNWDLSDARDLNILKKWLRASPKDDNYLARIEFLYARLMQDPDLFERSLGTERIPYLIFNPPRNFNVSEFKKDSHSTEAETAIAPLMRKLIDNQALSATDEKHLRLLIRKAGPAFIGILGDIENSDLKELVRNELKSNFLKGGTIIFEILDFVIPEERRDQANWEGKGVNFAVQLMQADREFWAVALGEHALTHTLSPELTGRLPEDFKSIVLPHSHPQTFCGPALAKLLQKRGANHSRASQ